MKAGDRRSEVGGQGTEVGSRKSEIKGGGQGPEVGSRRARAGRPEVGSRRSEGGGQRSVGSDQWTGNCGAL